MNNFWKGFYKHAKSNQVDPVKEMFKVEEKQFKERERLLSPRDALKGWSYGADPRGTASDSPTRGY